MAVVLGFGQGQELAAHTAATSAMLFCVKGEGRIGLGNGQEAQAQAGTWVHMPQH